METSSSLNSYRRPPVWTSRVELNNQTLNTILWNSGATAQQPLFYHADSRGLMEALPSRQDSPIVHTWFWHRAPGISDASSQLLSSSHLKDVQESKFAWFLRGSRFCFEPRKTDVRDLSVCIWFIQRWQEMYFILILPGSPVCFYPFFFKKPSYVILICACIGYFFHCYDKVPDKSPQGKTSILAHSLMAYRLSWWEVVTVGYWGSWSHASPPSSQEAVGAQLAFLFIQPRIPAHGQHLGSMFSPPLT